MKRSKISVKWKIYLYMMLFCLILIGFLWLFQIVLLEKFYKSIKTAESKGIYKQLTEMVKNEDDNLESKIDSIAGKHNISVLLTTTDLSYYYCANYNSTSSLLNMPTDIFNKLVEEARENDGTFDVTYIGNNNITMKDGIPDLSGETVTPRDPGHSFRQNLGMKSGESVIHVAIIDADKTEQVLLVNTVLSPVNSTVDTLKVQLIVVSVILAILALLFAFAVTNFVSRPIIMTNTSAKKLAEGDFSVEFTGQGYREIEELSDTLNYAAKELGKTEEFQHEIIANVSHDLRTPLTMITGYGEVMRDLPGENTPENVQVIIDEANRLTNLVNDMLDMSKLQAGVQVLEPSTYNLTASIEDVLKRYNKLREQEGYTIDFRWDKEAYVQADEYKIYQVIYNLINNAVNYTGEDKRVVVSQIIKEDAVRIEITDSGEGIPKEELKNVWERYYKIDKNHKRSISGSGLGLSIVKNILKLHDANYGVESEIGRGSTFWFELKTTEKAQNKH
ncbi:MAG: HAMP domain-containing histidine kinase [Lachnospiraceae bacterium]|nr:HAMP domain-containing histidine kinase [Lachnospiraceae bacterium]